MFAATDPNLLRLDWDRTIEVLVYNAGINNVRRRELRAIRRWTMSSPADGERNLVAIGDFNANPPGQTAHFANLVANPSGFRVLMAESRTAGEVPLRTTVPTKDSSSSSSYFTPRCTTTSVSPPRPTRPCQQTR